ncbi:MAG TPA: hypothetical protein VEG27_07210 [Usitatibacter sp.]|nr:hypothetical protein [Usitatibacter sp.]
MGSLLRQEWAAALEEHERRIEELSRTLAGLEGGVEADYANAQITRHRIDIALLASRLAAPGERRSS